MNTKLEDKECCPKFDPTLWDGQVLQWNKKKFIKEKVLTFFYVPLNYGGVMERCQEKIESAGASIPDALWLSDHTSKWNMDLYVAVDREIEDVQNVTLDGTFLCKVYEGDFKETGAWMKDFERYTKEKGKTIKKTFLWYTTCPKCAKKYGKNYVVVVGQL